MGDQLRLWEEIAAVDVIGVMMRVDDVANPFRAVSSDEIADQRSLLRKGQGIDDHRTIRGDDDRRCHFDV